MKNKSLLVVMLVLLAGTIQAVDLKVMTWNIRYNNPDDGENAWPLRKNQVTDLILFHAPDVIGMQEALLGQVNDIASRLPGYDWVGVGRDNGINAGEYSPIFYDSRRFQLKEQGWFWLSETPEIPSKGWDAALPRICTYIKLEEYDGRRNFWVFNTHFDHVGDEARKEAAKLIFDKIKELNDDKLPVILTGDFNLTPDTDPMKWLMRKMHDTRDMSEAEPYGPVGTFNGFDFNSPLQNRIDYIFVNRKVTAVRKYGVLTDSYDQKYPSDHLPVYVELWFK
ncbi:endonuclease/exonuclease/phosphatase family protein [Mangrovibacterium lignilyticum]|uniref:endonuclease/exonuclease/phosphatase family protein n=1 Tax=Mangrovibacterium lignilyticum TaxID=2668052 RepID=UPI0013D836FC|nr:endonuclease/exonuclease/phosphatase family protein [Mangrovibacterium lignilyticum]